MTRTAAQAETPTGAEAAIPEVMRPMGNKCQVSLSSRPPSLLIYICSWEAAARNPPPPFPFPKCLQLTRLRHLCLARVSRARPSLEANFLPTPWLLQLRHVGMIRIPPAQSSRYQWLPVLRYKCLPVLRRSGTSDWLWPRKVEYKVGLTLVEAT